MCGAHLSCGVQLSRTNVRIRVFKSFPGQQKTVRFCSHPCSFIEMSTYEIQHSNRDRHGSGGAFFSVGVFQCWGGMCLAQCGGMVTMGNSFILCGRFGYLSSLVREGAGRAGGGVQKYSLSSACSSWRACRLKRGRGGKRRTQEKKNILVNVAGGLS